MNLGFDESYCYTKLREVRWPDGIVCPLCKLGRVTTHTKFATTPRRRYLCLHCRRTFTDLTGTPFARTNLPLGTWASALRLASAGQSTSELARELGVAWDTAAHLARRIGEALTEPSLAAQFRQALENEQNAG
jgi:transposase-like protein